MGARSRGSRRSWPAFASMVEINHWCDGSNAVSDSLSWPVVTVTRLHFLQWHHDNSPLITFLYDFIEEPLPVHVKVVEGLVMLSRRHIFGSIPSHVWATARRKGGNLTIGRYLRVAGEMGAYGTSFCNPRRMPRSVAKMTICTCEKRSTWNSISLNAAIVAIWYRMRTYIAIQPVLLFRLIYEYRADSFTATS